MINEQIAKLPDEESSLALLGAFDKLLRKYARLLSYEDAYEELRLFFFELIYDMKGKDVGGENDGATVNYITTSVKNQYIFLSRKRKREDCTSFSEMSEEQIAFIERATATENWGQISDYFPSKDKLTKHEIEILYLLLVCGYSVNEIAKKYKTSRQAVNKSKLRALNKIRKAMK